MLPRFDSMLCPTPSAMKDFFGRQRTRSNAARSSSSPCPINACMFIIIDSQPGEPHSLAIGRAFASISSLLRALALLNVTIPRRGSSELSPTSRAVRLGCCARFLPLMPQQVAESRKWTSVAAVVPALRSRPRLEHSHRPFSVWRSRRRGRGPSRTGRLRRRITGTMGASLC